ncbi:DUF378 domain-containing protein [Clostridium sardiniense]|uniref:DUF378 domain-containing protein n=1 Tax=Clostridium sardiniense TaxID=29369 RepID=UPI00195B2DAE|nr:DUF378 domain-containing protein [Clostridium sardiniense]MBM7835188.1 uncharacterized membrane protein YuzA (DUF378 family) [Clostridium sardiniense]
MCKINILDKLSFLLVIIGALNWGLIGLLNFNLVTLLSFGIAMVSRIIYILIAISGINLITLLFRCKLISLK